MRLSVWGGLVIVLACMSCGGGFHGVQQADSVDAYETWLSTANVNDPNHFLATIRLEELRLAAVQEDESLEAYDAFLTRYPAGSGAKHREKAKVAREAFLFEWADASNTVESWQKFLDEYPKAERKRKRAARRRLNMAENGSAIELAEATQERVNLAEDPDGPLNGWGFWVNVTNVGTKPIERCVLRIRYLSDDRRTLGQDDWPVVAKSLPGNLPFEEGWDRPIKPGETRTWEWTTGELPEGWSQKIAVVPVDMNFVGQGAQ